VCRGGGGAIFADAVGDGGAAEALLLDDEADADEAAGEERQDYSLHDVRGHAEGGGISPQRGRGACSGWSWPWAAGGGKRRSRVLKYIW
jgi:hypothetical protein